ncbi:MAG: Gfo/Idh/MocA family oxidoreductase [Elusimicrobia bacterium]|nr:Gfo/Idh/MocA family oxidoreductase [Elusimicrobiota bacterium]
MSDRPFHVSVLGAGSAYGVYLVKWAFQLLRDPHANREGLSLPALGSISYSNTDARNTALVSEVPLDDLHQMAGFENLTADDLRRHVRPYERWREMVEKEKPDVVVLCSPTDTHVAIVRELITGFGVKNILCENPVTTLTDADSLPGLTKLVREAGVVFGVNQQYAALPEFLKDLRLDPGAPQAPTFGQVFEKADAAHITFITHGTRPWRRFGHIGELIILEDLGAHALRLIPPALWSQPLTVKNVVREGDNVFLNLVEYELRFGAAPVTLVLGYRRKLKSLKMVYGNGDREYDFHVTGTVSTPTGEFTRGIEGKNYAFPFRYALRTDLVKYAFMRSLAGRPLVPLEDALRCQDLLRRIYEGSSRIK